MGFVVGVLHSREMVGLVVRHMLVVRHTQVAVHMPAVVAVHTGSAADNHPADADAAVHRMAAGPELVVVLHTAVVEDNALVVEERHIGLVEGIGLEAERHIVVAARMVLAGHTAAVLAEERRTAGLAVRRKVVGTTLLMSCFLMLCSV